MRLSANNLEGWTGGCLFPLPSHLTPASLPLDSRFIEQHHDNEIKSKLSEGKLLRTLNFKIIPELCKEQGRTIPINEESETIHVSKPNEVGVHKLLGE
jgi:hypothetical protein